MISDDRSVHNFIRQLLSAITNVSLYGMHHPQVERLATQAHADICAVLENNPEFTLMVIDNELVVDGVPQEINLFLNRLTQILKSRGIGRITFLQGIGRQELDTLIVGLTKAGHEMASSDHLRFGWVEVRLGTESGAEGESIGGGVTRHIQLPDMPKEELARFMEIYETVRRRRKLKVNGMVEIVSGFVEVFRQEGRPLLVMAALRDTDEYTFTHSTNVCILNLAQAMSLGIKGQLLNEIGVSAMLHDIGKLFIPEEILTKKDKLSDGEFELMKQHPIKGARYLLEAPGVPRMASIAAFEHHAKFNLQGYPKLPADWRLNLCSHFTMISDFFDALRTRRPYREPLELNQISGMMQGMMGSELHPVLTRNFLNILSSLTKPA
jgi:HD-GYP domain-containing protein (c-di-GMP phosphodiesterase class II)